MNVGKTPITVRPDLTGDVPCPRCGAVMHEIGERCAACGTALWLEQRGDRVWLTGLITMAESPYCCENCGRAIERAGRGCSACHTPAPRPVDERTRAAAVARHLATRHVRCECGYDLFGAPSNRCPECNQRYTVVTLPLRGARSEKRLVPGPLAFVLMALAFAVMLLGMWLLVRLSG